VEDIRRDARALGGRAPPPIGSGGENGLIRYTGICQSTIATCDDQRRRRGVANDPVAGPHVQLAETTEYGNQQIQESTDSREPVY
jgi:hypothetical protein